MAAAVLLAGLGGGGVWAIGTLTEPCPGAPLSVTVAVEPEIAPPLREIADRFETARHRVTGRCVTVRITAADAATTARALGRGDSDVDAWVPESTNRLTEARRAGPGGSDVPPDGPSLAGSPVVFATTRPAADDLRAARVRPSWRLLLSDHAGGLWVAHRMLDPAVDTTGTFAMAALDQVANPGRAAVAELRRTAPKGVAPLFAELTGVDRFGRPLLVTSEQTMVNHNLAHRPNPAVALVPHEGTLMLDYPLAVVAKDPQRREAVDAFLSAARSRSSRITLQRYGFRAPDGTIGASQARRLGLDPAAPKPLKLPTRKELDRAAASWRVSAPR
ncbi:extracellular solute-binding protein [Thermomonospora umbrina]|uniref:Extracellular solute-binding protein n=1 Tax=Thermomonospora umbrina TaxID=111806 RepID=A0A3D9SR61_9ACTN|nr:extracellular solute-binding protein [Thermomonospora umbrina]